MSKSDLMSAIHQLDGMGIVIVESDEELIEEIDELGLAEDPEEL